MALTYGDLAIATCKVSSKGFPAQLSLNPYMKELLANWDVQGSYHGMIKDPPAFLVMAPKDQLDRIETFLREKAGQTIDCPPIRIDYPPMPPFPEDTEGVWSPRIIVQFAIYAAVARAAGLDAATVDAIFHAAPGGMTNGAKLSFGERPPPLTAGPIGGAVTAPTAPHG